MTNAEVTLQVDSPLEIESPGTTNTLTADVPLIQPEMAQLLEMSQANGSSLTPREINAQLDRVLHDYDTLTALYAENKQRIDHELATIRLSAAGLSSQLHQLDGGMRQQSHRLDTQTTGTENRFAIADRETAAVRSELQAARQEIDEVQHQVRASRSDTALLRGDVDSLRGDTQRWLSETAHRLDQRLADDNARVATELAKLDGDLAALDKLLKTQDHILFEQRQRLDQFDITYQLLDTATRGNKSRIEAVREQTAKEHALVETRIDGLSALQREHHAEFQNLQGLVGILKSETQRLDQAIVDVASQLTTHRHDTQKQFKRTHLAIGGLLLLTVLGFAMVKWLPAFSPVSTDQTLVQHQAQLTTINGQLSDLTARDKAQQAVSTQQQTALDQVTGQVVGLEKSLNGLRASIRKMGIPVAGSGVLHDSSWLLRQNPKAYTVQLVTSPSQADMSRFIDQNMTHLALDSLAFSVSSNQRERYNLFFGVFNTVGQARAAIAALPPALTANRPWVRQFESIQESIR